MRMSCNGTLGICTLSELHILVSSRKKSFETAKQIPKVVMNPGATNGFFHTKPTVRNDHSITKLN